MIHYIEATAAEMFSSAIMAYIRCSDAAQTWMCWSNKHTLHHLRLRGSRLWTGVMYRQYTQFLIGAVTARFKMLTPHKEGHRLAPAPRYSVTEVLSNDRHLETMTRNLRCSLKPTQTHVHPRRCQLVTNEKENVYSAEWAEWSFHHLSSSYRLLFIYFWSVGPKLCKTKTNFRVPFYCGVALWPTESLLNLNVMFTVDGLREDEMKPLQALVSSFL